MKTGAGTLSLTGTTANTYSGGSTINAGVVSLGTGGGTTSHQDALGTGAVTVNSGGELRLWINNTASFTLDNAFTLDGGTIHSEDGQYDITGTMALSAGGGTLSGKWDNKYVQVSGVISGAGALTIDEVASSQNGHVILSGANTYSGATTVTAGLLQLGNNAALGSTAGATTVSSGAELDGASFDPTSGENFTISGTGRDGAGGRGALYSTANSTSFAGGSTITLAADAEIGGGGGRIDNSATINGGGFNLIKVGTENWWNWSGSASNIDTLTVYTGQWLGFGNAALANAANDVHVMTNAEIMTWASGHSFTSPMAFDDNARFRNYWGAGNTSTHSISGDITLTGSPRFEDNGNSLGRRTLTISGAIGGTGTLSKAGLSKLILSGTSANTYSGGTTLNHGSIVLQKTAGLDAIPGDITIGDGSGADTLRLGASNQIADTAVLSIHGLSSGNSGKFELNGFDETVGGITHLGTLSVIQVEETGTGASSTLTVDNATDYTYSGIIRNNAGGSSTLSLSKGGAGTLALQIANATTTYTGNTTVSAGTLQFRNTADLAGMSPRQFFINGTGTLEIESSVGGA